MILAILMIKQKAVSTIQSRHRGRIRERDIDITQRRLE